MIFSFFTKNTLLLIGLCGLTSLFAQNRFQQYGTGILHKDGSNTFWQNEGTLFSIYDAPHGKLIGSLQYKGYSAQIHWQDSSQREQYGSFRMFDFGADVNPFMVWYVAQTGYLQISFPEDQGGLWLEEKEWNELGIQKATWEEVLDKHFFSQEHIVIAEPCLNLRVSPQQTADKITCLNGRYLIEFTGEQQGKWRQVKVNLYKYNCLERQQEMGDIPKHVKQEVLESYTGWLKIVNEQGAPFLFYHLCGC